MGTNDRSPSISFKDYTPNRETTLFLHRDLHIILLSKLDSLSVSRICMSDDSHAGIGGEDALDAFCSFGRAVGDDDLAGVEAVTDPDSTVVMERDPSRTARDVS